MISTENCPRPESSGVLGRGGYEGAKPPLFDQSFGQPARPIQLGTFRREPIPDISPAASSRASVFPGGMRTLYKFDRLGSKFVFPGRAGISRHFRVGVCLPWLLGFFLLSGVLLLGLGFSHSIFCSASVSGRVSWSCTRGGRQECTFSVYMLRHQGGYEHLWNAAPGSGGWLRVRNVTAGEPWNRRRAEGEMNVYS